MAQTSLWMGDLEPDHDEEYLEKLYESLGYKLVSIRMIKDKITGKTAGYCFIEFADQHTAQSVLMNLNLKPWPNTVNKLLKLNWAATNQANRQEHSVYVGELSSEVDDHLLYKFFAAGLPSCKSAKVVADSNGTSKGFGFVRFSSETDSRRAIAEYNLSPGLGTRRIRVCKAFPKQGERRQDQFNNSGQYPQNMADPWQNYQQQMSAYNQNMAQYQQQYSDATDLEPYDDGLSVEDMNKEYIDYNREFTESMDATRWNVIDSINCTKPAELVS